MRRLRLDWLAAVGAIFGLAEPAAAELIPVASYSYTSSPSSYTDVSGMELTDGFIADRHYPSYYSPQAGYGAPYVGWRNVDPQVAFGFAGTRTFGRVTAWIDDSHGAYGVTAPVAISALVGGIAYSRFIVGAPLDVGHDYSGTLGSQQSGGGTPFILDLAGAVGDRVDLRIERGGEWTFVSEVQFSTEPFAAAAVPEPASWAMMIVGFGAVGGSMRRRRARVIRMAFGG